MYKQDIALYCK